MSEESESRVWMGLGWLGPIFCRLSGRVGCTWYVCLSVAASLSYSSPLQGKPDPHADEQTSMPGYCASGSGDKAQAATEDKTVCGERREVGQEEGQACLAGAAYPALPSIFAAPGWVIMAQGPGLWLL